MPNPVDPYKKGRPQQIPVMRKQKMPAGPPKPATYKRQRIGPKPDGK